jgi:hypothetical protein
MWRDPYQSIMLSFIYLLHASIFHGPDNLLIFLRINPMINGTSVDTVQHRSAHLATSDLLDHLLCLIDWCIIVDGAQRTTCQTQTHVLLGSPTFSLWNIFIIFAYSVQIYANLLLQLGEVKVRPDTRFKTQPTTIIRDLMIILTDNDISNKSKQKYLKNIYI